MSKEIVLVMGFPASGKSTSVQSFVDQGYYRINRDLDGSSIEQCATKADNAIRNFGKSVILDNLYPTVESRQSIIAVAKKHKIPIRCNVMETSMEDSMLNACLRMIRTTGKLLTEPEDFKAHKDNPNIFPVAVIYKYRKEFEKPTLAEGFGQIISIPFIRQWDADEYRGKAIILDYDGTLRESTGPQKYPTTPSEIKILSNRTKVLNTWKSKEYKLLGVSNQSGISKKVLTSVECHGCFQATNEKLSVDIDYSFCPHKVPPISCYCRKPNCGLGALFIERYKLNPKECIMVGDLGSDKSFAGRCGFQYADADDFFK